MRISTTAEGMNTDINVLISEAKIRRELTDEDIGKQISMKKSSIQTARSSHTLPNLSFWKVAAIANLAGYEVILEKKGG